MIRGAALLALVLAAPAQAAELSPPLSLELMRSALAAGGLNRGKIFAVGEARYAISGVTVERNRRVFTIRVVIDPLQMHVDTSGAPNGAGR